MSTPNYERWWKNHEESLAALRASVPDCNHPPQFIGEWEDGSRHCWECEWYVIDAELSRVRGLLQRATQLLTESQEYIGGTWRDRRDEFVKDALAESSLSSPPPKRHCGDRHLAMNEQTGYCSNCRETERVSSESPAPQKCPDCSGQGHITARKPMGGFGSQSVECWTCKGTGKLVAHPDMSDPKDHYACMKCGNTIRKCTCSESPAPQDESLIPEVIEELRRVSLGESTGVRRNELIERLHAHAAQPSGDSTQTERCSLCGGPRIPKGEQGAGTCTLIGCKDPLHDNRAERGRTDGR